jgi:hypothetical protein
MTEGGKHVNGPASGAGYEPPRLTTVGSVKELTLGEGLWGNDDSFVFHLGPFEISIPYGEAS